MALDFSGGATNASRIEVASSPISTTPMTIAYWFNKDNTTATNGGLTLRNAAGTHYVNTGHSNVLILSINNNTTDLSFSTTATYSTATWHHACFTTDGSTHNIYLNGGNNVNNTTARTPTGLNQMRVGTFATASGFNGLLAEIGLWNEVLSVAEIESLADGFSCSQVKPASLVFHLPLIREVQDVRQARALTLAGSTLPFAAAHPRIYA